MLSRAVARAAPRVPTGTRAFHATRARLSSPYHYPDGPRSNLPFNTQTKFFWLRYTTYVVVGFGAPFGIAGASISQARRFPPVRERGFC